MLVDSDTEITNSRLSRNYYEIEKYEWYISTDSCSFTVDAKTSELTSYNLYSYSDDEIENPLSKEQLTKKAKDFIQKTSSDTYRNIDLTKDGSFNNKRTYFNFPRVENGFEVLNNNVNITIGNDGTILSYSKDWDDTLKFQPINNTIKDDELFEAFNKHLNYDFMYSKVVKNSKDNDMDEDLRISSVSSYSKDSKDDVLVVYAPSSGLRNLYIDPYKGVRLANDGTPYKENVKDSGYSDISGHEYEDIINKVLENGYFIDDADFKPDEEITQLRFLRFLLSNKYSYLSDQDEFYKRCVSLDLLKKSEINPEKIMTKYDCAEIFAKLLVDSNILEKNEIFVKPFDDVDNSKTAVSAVVTALGIIEGDNDLFNGNKNITNAETAAMIYNMIG